jgi:single-strand DNA-binding protein
MEITARLTADAQVTTLKDERTVVNFTVAHNEYYKPKGSTESKQVTEFIRCSYWLSAGIAEYLTKGALVEISGRIGVNAYTTSEGEAKANLTCHVNKIKLHGGSKKQNGSTEDTTVATPPNATTATPSDDLPF